MKKLYPMIFKRKTFHLFRKCGNMSISESEILEIYHYFKRLIPLIPDIRTEIRILPSSQASCNRGEEYSIVFYSEKKANFLQNIGYLGEQLDLFLTSKNIGTLWFGIGKVKDCTFDGLHFVIMMGIRKIDDESKFRRDMFKCKRKKLEEIWQGQAIDGVSEIVRFAPSACNTQPWLVRRDAQILEVFRYKKPGKRGIMPMNKITYYNQIDIGIFLCFLEVCLSHENIPYTREIFSDSPAEQERMLTAVYRLHTGGI